MKYEPFHSLILKLRENEITRERFIYEWAQCQWAQREEDNYETAIICLSRRVNKLEVKNE